MNTVRRLVRIHQTPQKMGKFGVLSPAGYYLFYKIVVELLVGLRAVLDFMIDTHEHVNKIICRMLGRLTFGVKGEIRLFRDGAHSYLAQHKAVEVEEEPGLFKVVALFIERVYLVSLNQEFNMVINRMNNRENMIAIIRDPKTLFKSEGASNIELINQNVNRGNLPAPRATRTPYNEVFREFFTEIYRSDEMNMNVRERRERMVGIGRIMDKRVGISYHVFPDECSDEEITYKLVRELINKEISEALERVFEKTFLSARFEEARHRGHMERLITGIDFFVGFEFVKTALHNDEVVSLFRSAGFKIEFRKFDTIDEELQDEQNPRWAPRHIRVLRHVKSMGLGEKLYYESLGPVNLNKHYMEKEIIESVMRGIYHDGMGEIVSHIFSSASGGFEDDEKFAEAQIQMTGMTIFRFPIYAPGFIPVVAMLRAPCGSGQQYHHLLKERTGDFDEVKEYLKLEFEEEKLENLKCMGVAVIKFLSIITHNHDMMSLEELDRYMKEIVEELIMHDVNCTRTWLEVLLKILKEIKLEVPIILFIVSGCQILQFNSTILSQRKIHEMIFSGSIPNDFPIFAISNEFTENAHAFLTTVGCLKEFVDAKANAEMRSIEDERGITPCFEFYPSKLPYPQRGESKITHKEAAAEVMKHVWTLDIETYNAKDERMDPYCIRVYDGKDDVWSYMGRPEELTERFSNDFLQNLKASRNEESEELIIYAHNGSRFDWVVLFREVVRVFPDIKYFGRLTELKYIIIPSINVKLSDFYLMVSDSLANIAKQFKTKSQKIECKEIIGLDNIDVLSGEERDNIWKYCLNDCVVLWECIQSFADKICEILQLVAVPEPGFILPPTSAKLATNIFSSKFLKSTIYGTTSLEIDNIETSAYYGGVTQVFNCAKKHNIYYVDVNSLYPAAMCDIAIQYKPATTASLRNKQWRLGENNVFELKEHNIYKVHYFEFKTNALGMLPVRTKEGGLCYPRCYKGENDWRTGVELMELVRSNMLSDLEIVRELDYPYASKGLFKEYIETIYSKKANSEGVEKMIYELLLNQLYGKFAQRKFDKRYLVKKSTIRNDPEIVSRLAVSEVNAAFISDLMRANESQVGYKLLFEEFEKQEHSSIPILTAVNKVDEAEEFVELVYESKNEDVHYLGFLKRVSLMVTGYARAIMIRAMSSIASVLDLRVDKMCEHIFYMDTDSFFLSAFAMDVLKQNGLIHNSDLGKFKVETEQDEIIVEGHFFAAKVYYLVIENGKRERRTYCKFKGIRKKYFEELKTDKERIAVFTDMLDERVIPELTQERWERSFSKIMITDIVKMTISRPRRMVMGDGSTTFFNTVEEMEDFNKERRLVMNHLGIYYYTKFSKTENEK